MPEQELAIRLRGVTTRFGSHVVHENLDLDVRRGEIIGLVGGSGSGKSVLLRTIIGLKKPAAGQVILYGDAGESMTPGEQSRARNRFGVLFQHGALFSSLTVLENVELPLREHLRLSWREAATIASAKLALAGLPADTGSRYPADLSGGMIKRAALARALAMDPAILFLDEPTAGLDPISAGAFDGLIKTLRDALGLTVFLVTHDLDTLYSTCDRVAVLADKRILVCDRLEKVADTEDEWIREYFHGPRGRAAAPRPS